MKNETAYQAEIVKAVKELGGWGKKLSNRFLIGVPDLVIVLRPFGTMIVEVKKVDHHPSTNRAVDSGLTPLQESNLREIVQAGGNCGVLLISPGGPRGALKVWGIYGAASTYVPKEFHECAMTKSPTNPWDRLLPILLSNFVAP